MQARVERVVALILVVQLTTVLICIPEWSITILMRLLPALAVIMALVAYGTLMCLGFWWMSASSDAQSVSSPSPSSSPLVKALRWLNVAVFTNLFTTLAGYFMTYLYNEDLVAKYGVILMKIFGLERTINHMSVSELLEGKRDRRAVVFGDNTYVDKTPEPAVLVPTTPPPPPCRAYTIPSSTLGDAPQAIPCTQRTFRGIMRPSIKRVLRNNTVNTLIDVIETVAREQSEQPPVIVAAPAAPVVMPPAAVAVAATAAVPPPTTKRVTAPVIRPITARELETSQNGPCASAAVEARSPGPVQVVPVTGTT